MTKIVWMLLVANSVQSHAVLLGGEDVEGSGVFERESANETTGQCDDLHVLCPRNGDVVMRRSSTKHAFAKWVAHKYGQYTGVARERAAIASLYGIFKMLGGAVNDVVDAGVVPIPALGLATRGLVFISSWVYDTVVGCGSVTFEFCGPHEVVRPATAWEKATGRNSQTHPAAGLGLPAMTFDYAAYAYVQMQLGRMKFPYDREFDEAEKDDKVTEEEDIVRKIDEFKKKTWMEKRRMVSDGSLSVTAYGLHACASVPALGGAWTAARGLGVSYTSADGKNTVTTRIPKMEEFNHAADFENTESPWNVYMTCFALLCGELDATTVAKPVRFDFIRGVNANSCDHQDQHMVVYDTFGV